MSLVRAYDLMAPFYDLVYNLPLLGLRAEQGTALAWIEGKNVLEIGCGTGYLLARIPDSTRRVVGLDISRGMLARARRKLGLSGKDAVLVRGSYYDMPFDSGSFDCVVGTFTLTHAPRLGPVAAEIARVLRPGGRLVAVDVGPSQKPWFLSRLMNHLWRLLGDHPRDEEPVLEKSGFSIIFRRELSKAGTVHLVVAEKVD